MAKLGVQLFGEGLITRKCRDSGELCIFVQCETREKSRYWLKCASGIIVCICCSAAAGFEGPLLMHRPRKLAFSSTRTCEMRTFRLAGYLLLDARGPPHGDSFLIIVHATASCHPCFVRALVQTCRPPGVTSPPPCHRQPWISQHCCCDMYPTVQHCS